MTNEQAEWLRAHRFSGYEAIGQGKKYVRRGLLHPDGTFDAFDAGNPRPKIRQGTFEVGVPAAKMEGQTGVGNG